MKLKLKYYPDIRLKKDMLYIPFDNRNVDHLDTYGALIFMLESAHRRLYNSE